MYCTIHTIVLNYTLDVKVIIFFQYELSQNVLVNVLTVPGLTGVCMVVVLFLMVTASTYAIR